MADPIDTDAIRSMIGDRSNNLYDAEIQSSALCDAVDRLRAERDLAQRGLVEALNSHDAMAERVNARLDKITAEVDRLRAENTALAAALEDIAGMVERKDMAGNRIWIPEGECTDMGGGTCYQADPADPGEWCPVCVAEVAWCAWKMGVLS